MSKSARDMIDAAKRRESTLRLCLRGDLIAEHEILEAELAELTLGAGAPDDARVEEVAARLVALREEMLEDTVTIRFRALRRRAYEELVDGHKQESGLLDLTALAVPLVAACVIDPEMSTAEVEELFDVINDGQRLELFNAAWNVNAEASEVPFSERASVVMRTRALK